MPCRVDLHSHTLGSDGHGTPVEIARAAKKYGLRALALTDHHTNTTNEVLHVADALLALDVVPILGCEYSTDDGHLLIFGTVVKPYRWGQYPSMQEVVNEVNAEGGVCITPHPYKGYKRALRNKVMDIRGLAAVETLNGQCEVRGPEDNRKAEVAARTMRIPEVGSSDAHSPGWLGVCFTEFDEDVDSVGALLRILKSGKGFRPKADEDRVTAMAEGRKSSWQSQQGTLVYADGNFTHYADDYLGPKYDDYESEVRTLAGGRPSPFTPSPALQEYVEGERRRLAAAHKKKSLTDPENKRSSGNSQLSPGYRGDGYWWQDDEEN